MDLKLEKLKDFKPRKGTVLLVVMDGVGFGKQDESDAVYLAKTPNLDKLLTLPNKTRLKAHGTAVGLPSDDDMGNSEVGHNALGAGRIFAQGAKLVNNSIETGEFFKSEKVISSITERRNCDGTARTIRFFWWTDSFKSCVIKISSGMFTPGKYIELTRFLINSFT